MTERSAVIGRVHTRGPRRGTRSRWSWAPRIEPSSRSPLHPDTRPSPSRSRWRTPRQHADRPGESLLALPGIRAAASSRPPSRGSRRKLARASDFTFDSGGDRRGGRGASELRFRRGPEQAAMAHASRSARHDAHRPQARVTVEVCGVSGGRARGDLLRSPWVAVPRLMGWRHRAASRTRQTPPATWGLDPRTAPAGRISESARVRGASISRERRIRAGKRGADALRAKTGARAISWTRATHCARISSRSRPGVRPRRYRRRRRARRV